MKELRIILTDIAKRFSYEDILEELNTLSGADGETSYVDLVVLGRFKAGKSSLINSIVGKQLLPVGVLPVTAIITRVQYGESESMTVTEQDGSVFNTELSKLPQFVSESENPENKKGVAVVDIYTPAMSSMQNLRIIDTPGLGSAFKHNTEVTRKWYNKIGAALVVMNVSQACAEDDSNLIASATEHSPLVYLLLSKTDLLQPEESQEVVAFVQRKSGESFKKQLPVLQYSIRTDEERYRKKLFEKVLMPLHKSYRDARLKIYSHKLNRLKELTRSYLNITLKVRRRDANMRQGLKEEIIGEQLKLDLIKKELQLITISYKDKTRKILEKEIVEKHKKQLAENLSADLEHEKSLMQGNLNRVSRNYERWLRKAMEHHLRQVEKETRPQANRLVADAGRHVTNYCNAFRGRLNHNLQKVLGVTMPEDDFTLKVEPVEKPNIMTSWAFESHIDLLWFLIPMALFRNRIRAHFKKQLPYEAEKNLYRLTAQFTQNINGSIDTLHIKAVDYITGQLSAIEKLLEENSSDTEPVLDYLNLIDE